MTILRQLILPQKLYPLLFPPFTGILCLPHLIITEEF